jgi:glutamate dehydrogenase
VTRLVAAAPALQAVPAIVRLAEAAGVPPAQAAEAWGEVGHRLHLPLLRQCIAAAPASGPFATRARAALLDDLAAAQGRLATRCLRSGLPEAEAVARIVQEAAARPDLAAATVAVRELSRLG